MLTPFLLTLAVHRLLSFPSFLEQPPNGMPLVPAIANFALVMTFFACINAYCWHAIAIARATTGWLFAKSLLLILLWSTVMYNW